MAGLSKVSRVISANFGEIPIKADGAQFKPSGHKRETQDGEQPENSGYVETPTHAELKLKLNASVDPQTLDTGEDTLTVFLADGHQHVMPKAYTVEMGELGKGEFDIEYHSAVSQKLA